MMKNLFPIIVLFLLSASTHTPNQKPVETVAPEPSATTSADPQQDLILRDIQDAFSKSLHAAKFSCEQCHSTNGGVVTNNLTWKDVSSGLVEVISTSTQLCAKCHEGQLAPSSLEDTTTIAHVNFECTSCHDPHSGQASCTQSICHSDIRSTLYAQVEQPEFHSTTSGDPNSPYCGGSACHELASQVAMAPIYHQPVHRNIPCYVCHDASGMKVTMNDNQSWITVDNSNQGNSSAIKESVSHIIGTGSGCSRCHYYENPWNLINIGPNN
jgi:hypothetical protein